jgi:hypothetical protein
MLGMGSLKWQTPFFKQGVHYTANTDQYEGSSVLQQTRSTVAWVWATKHIAW